MPGEVKDAVFAEQARTLPVGRVGQADDVAHAVHCMMENGFVAGSIVERDGGLHLV